MVDSQLILELLFLHWAMLKTNYNDMYKIIGTRWALNYSNIPASLRGSDEPPGQIHP